MVRTGRLLLSIYIPFFSFRETLLFCFETGPIRYNFGTIREREFRWFSV